MALALKLPDWTKWLRVARAESKPAILSRRHIYILPTRYGWSFAFVLLLMLIGAINYTLSLGFVLVFLLAGIGNMAMLHTWRNLAHLQVTAGKIEPVFADEEATFEILVADTKHHARYAIAAHFAPEKSHAGNTGNHPDGFEPACVDIAEDSQTIAKLRLASQRRGWLIAPRIKLYTEFPLALFHAWAYVDLDCRCLIYPRPAINTLPLPAAPDQDANGSADAVSGDDDFFGHRTYQLGDSPKRVDWKASSREQGMFTKQFQGTAQSSLWLDWSVTPGNDDEQRIRQLARWAVDADAANIPYGLRLPNREIPPNIGKQHYHQCLQALALM